MPVLKIPNKLTEKKLEQLSLELDGIGVDLDLHLPVHIDYRGFGILPQFFLLFFTWMRKKKGKIILSLEPDKQKEIQDFVFDYYGYTLISTIWKCCEIENENGVSLKNSLRDFTGPMHDQIDFLQDIPKESVLIPNFDHYSKIRGLSHWFYNSRFDFFDTPSGLENTLFRVLEKLSVNRKDRIKAGSRDIFGELQEILWELAKNTDEHAVSDYLNQIILSPNSRCMYFKIQQSSKANFLKAAKDHGGLSSYYQQALKDDLNFMLEISIFDSGPGIVKRFLGKKWDTKQSVANDVASIKQCLIKGQSSIQSGKGINKGFGLDNVLKLLDRQKGFLKIRSGRTSLYRNLITHPYIETQNIQDVAIYDWEQCSNSAFTEMSYLEGTMISMVYPINEAI